MVKAEQMGNEMSTGRQAIVAAFFGFFVDMVDVYLPIVALTPAMIYFEPKGLSPAISTTLYYLIFACTLIGRPLGSFIFGYFGDKMGRRKATLIAAAGCSITTFLIACLPGYSFWGLTGIILLAMLRLIGGIFLGGEYTGANPLAMEYCPKAKRGFYGGMINAGFPAAIIVVSLITLLMLYLMPALGPDSLYAIWGWRVPFLFGAAISFILYVYYYRNVPESEVWRKSKKSDKPIKELFQGESFRRLCQVFIVMSGVWFLMQGVVSAMPGIFKLLNVSNGVSTYSQLISNIVLLFLIPFAGALSQKIGRRVVLITIGVFGLTLAPGLYYVLVSSGYKTTFGLIILSVLINALTIPVYGVLTAYITEMFNTGVRASGYGIGYSLAVVIPSFSSFFMLWLANMMPYKFTEIVITIMGGILLAIGGLISPETRDAEFGPVEIR